MRVLAAGARCCPSEPARSTRDNSSDKADANLPFALQVHNQNLFMYLFLIFLGPDYFSEGS
jgi:hypothetical protein